MWDQQNTMTPPKLNISATIDAELVEWMDTKIKDRTFRNRSHALEVAAARLMESMTEDDVTRSHKGPIKAVVTA